MAQFGASKCSLLIVLSTLLSLNSFVSSGFISPGNSVSIGTSPTLRFLLECGHLAAKLPACSDPLLSDFTQYIYTQGEVLKCVFVFVFIFVCM